VFGVTEGNGFQGRNTPSDILHETPKIKTLLIKKRRRKKRKIREGKPLKETVFR